MNKTTSKINETITVPIGNEPIQNLFTVNKNLIFYSLFLRNPVEL